MRNVLIFLFSLIFIIACSNNELEQKADAALKNGEYHEAWDVYKQAIAKKPNRDVLYEKLQKTASFIVNEGHTFFANEEYGKCLKALKPLVVDAEYPVSDARIISAAAYFYGYPYDLKQIFAGQELLQKTMARANKPFRVTSFPSKVIKWLTKQGLLNDDIQGNRFTGRDIGLVYRTMLLYHIAKTAIQTTKSTFPVPEKWEEAEQKQFVKAHKLFTWIIHNVALVDESNSRYFKALVPNVFIRGYGSREEMVASFIYLCLQSNIRAYLIEPRVEKDGKLTVTDPYALVNIGEQWIIFDFATGSPLVNKDNNPINVYKALKGEEKEEPIKGLAKSVIWVVLPPRSIIPRITIYSQTFKKCDITPPPSFHMPMHRLALFTYKSITGNNELPEIDSFLNPSDKELAVAYYPKRFQVWGLYNNNKEFNEKIKPLQEVVKSVGKIRINSFYGLYDDALKAFAKLAEDKKHIEDLTYYQAMTLLNKNDLEAAKKSFLEYTTKYSQGFWSAQVQIQLAQIYIAEKQIDKARECYAKSKRFSDKVIDILVTKARQSEN